MIKKVLYFGNPAYLSLKNKQMVIRLPEIEKSNLSQKFKNDSVITRPIEDLGFIIIDNKQITITSGLIEELLENNCALVTCNSSSMPAGMMLNLSGNTVQSERFRIQIDASLPMKKQLWQQTVQAKIYNQFITLNKSTNDRHDCMKIWSQDVRSGDPDNLEARAAAYYWRNYFPMIDDFVRIRDGEYPNNLLNYGYAILRAVVARALVGSGLLPTFGIHHRSKYNAYCLADDIMEPYRPYVDELVFDMVKQGIGKELTREVKAILLKIPSLDVKIKNLRRPLMVAVSITTASLVRCFNGELRKISYPLKE